MSTDDMNNLTPEDHDSSGFADSLLSAEQSRRRFLRTAVVGTAGVAGAAGVAGIILSQRGAQPNLLTIGAIAGVSESHFHMLFEDTDCGTSGTASKCGDYSTTQFTINKGGHSTSPGSFFIVLAISDLPADSYTITAKEKLHTAPTYQNIPTSTHGSSTLPFEYQSAFTTVNNNIQVYQYPAGTITGSGPYALTAPPYNTRLSTHGGASFTVPTPSTPPAPRDVLIFIHVSWHNAVTLPAKGDTITIDFEITLSSAHSGSVTEKTSTTGKQA